MPKEDLRGNIPNPGVFMGPNGNPLFCADNAGRTADYDSQQWIGLKRYCKQCDIATCERRCFVCGRFISGEKPRYWFTITATLSAQQELLDGGMVNVRTNETPTPEVQPVSEHSWWAGF